MRLITKFTLNSLNRVPNGEIAMKYFWDTITSKAYWQYVLLSRRGVESILAIFGGIYLLIESLDFFKIYSRDVYSSYAFFIFLALSILIAIAIRRPIHSISIPFPKHDFVIEVRVGNLFEVVGSIMISTNTRFEADVSGGKISPDSLQGQFTGKYFTGNQTELISSISRELKQMGESELYPLGTTIPISTHGKTFYFTAMANLNEMGNAETTPENVKIALDGLWKYVREAGELQNIAVPVVGTGRGRLGLSRNKTIALIAESFVKAAERFKFSDKLIIMIRPEDARNFCVNLYDVKDHLVKVLES